MTNNMLKNGFCQNMDIIELEVLNQGMIKLALEALKVDTSLVSSHGSLTRDKFAELAYCLRKQSRQLNDMRKTKFDKLWG
jgi:hypothetical protein